MHIYRIRFSICIQQETNEYRFINEKFFLKRLFVWFFLYHFGFHSQEVFHPFDLPFTYNNNVLKCVQFIVLPRARHDNVLYIYNRIQ